MPLYSTWTFDELTRELDKQYEKNKTLNEEIRDLNAELDGTPPPDVIESTLLVRIADEIAYKGKTPEEALIYVAQSNDLETKMRVAIETGRKMQ